MVNFLESTTEKLTQCLLNSAAGKGCFYIGLGGKSTVPNPSYEPYQCCPSKAPRSSKVANASPAAAAAARKFANSNSRLDKPSFTATGKESNPRDNKPLVTSKDKGKGVSSGKEKPEKSKKGKKSFFGSGKYTWWW